MSNEAQKDFKQKIITYFKGVKNEWSKVSWPTRKQLFKSAVIVMIASVIIALIIFFMDYCIESLMNLIYGLA